MKTHSFADQILKSRINSLLLPKLKEAIKGFDKISLINKQIYEIKRRINEFDSIYRDLYEGNVRDILIGESAERINGMWKDHLNCCLNKGEINKFADEFDELINKENSKEALSFMIMQDVCQTITNPIYRAFNRNFNLKTSEMKLYSLPPMGMNEFVVKSVEKDIFDMDTISGGGTL